MCGGERRGSPEATARFRYRLSKLKQKGSNILLVGTDALDAACERLLGNSGAGPRYRLFVTTDERPTTARSKLAAVRSNLGEDEAAVVNWQADVSGAAAADGVEYRRSSGGGGAPNPDDSTLREVSVESTDLVDLGTSVETVIDQFDEDIDGLSPAELRLCFDSITPLLADYERREVRRFLLGLTESVEGVSGMAHYHLPAEYGSEPVELLEPLFDAVVEVRRESGRIEQRWHLTDPEATTDWLSL